MTVRKVRVAVNGYGVIGKRIADAVAAQTDMELFGVADVRVLRSCARPTASSRLIAR